MRGQHRASMGRGIHGRGQMVRDFAKSLTRPKPQGTVPITEIRRDPALFDADSETNEKAGTSPKVILGIPGYVAVMSRSRIAVCLAAGLVVAVAVLALTIGPWIWGPDWHVYGDESRQTTTAQEKAAMKCAPWLSSVSVLAISPSKIDIHLHGSAGRARRVARCMSQSPGIVDAEPIRSR
jgi:hypothetical protein